jgi:hypothetical protein
MIPNTQRASEIAIGDLDRQPAIEQVRKVCAIVLVPLMLIAAPMGFLTSSIVVSSICGGLLMLSGAALFLVE